jgi:spermidine/putrescine-binding protein
MKALRKSVLVFLFTTFFTVQAFAEESIRVFTWEGYVTSLEISAVNVLLKEQGYDYQVEVIKPFAEGPEQMFTVLRQGVADVSFLTLNYIKMQDSRIAKLLQPINTSSARIPNYNKLIPALKDIPFGMDGTKHLYVPWGGGAYGIWANMKELKEGDLPVSVKDLWLPEWKGKLSLTEGQIQPNIALVMLALDKSPFYLNDASWSELAAAQDADSEIQKKTNELYANVGFFWGGSPDFSKHAITLVSSYGIAASAENKKGGQWKLLSLQEGNTVWLDTINIHKDVTGKKLEAVELLINYWLGTKVQNHIVNELGMIAVTQVVANPLLIENPCFFKKGFFWPPWNRQADNVMKTISKAARKY